MKKSEKCQIKLKFNEAIGKSVANILTIRRIFNSFEFSKFIKECDNYSFQSRASAMSQNHGGSIQNYNMNNAVASISSQIHSSGPVANFRNSAPASGINSPAYPMASGSPDAATAAANAALGNNGRVDRANSSGSIWTGRDNNLMTGTGVGANMRTMGGSTYRQKAGALDRASPIRAGGSIGLIGARRR